MKRLPVFIALIAFLILFGLFLEYHHSSPLRRAFPQPYLLLIPIYFLALILTGRFRSVRILDLLFWGILAFIALNELPNHKIAWFASAIIFCFWINLFVSAIWKDRIVYHSRLHDVLWYSSWSILMLILKTSVWGGQRGFADNVFHFGLSEWDLVGNYSLISYWYFALILFAYLYLRDLRKIIWKRRQNKRIATEAQAR